MQVPSGGTQVSTGISTASWWRARSAAWRSACTLPGDPLTPAKIRHVPGMVMLPLAKWSWAWQEPGIRSRPPPVGARGLGGRGDRLRCAAHARYTSTAAVAASRAARRRSGRSASRACRRPQRCGPGTGGSGGCLFQPGGRGGNGRASAAGAAAANASRAPASPARAAARRRIRVHDKFLRLMLDRSMRVWAGQRHARYPTFYGCPNPCGLA